MRAAWLTDIHLDFVAEPDRVAFYGEVKGHAPDVVLIGGDIGEADTVCEYLSEMGSHLQRPIYFVLGNHDYYRGSISVVREAVGEFSRHSTWLRYLPNAGVVSLTDRTALIGHDGWADGRLGTYMKSEMILNDYLLIRDFNPLLGERTEGEEMGDESLDTSFFTGRHAKLLRLKTLNALGDEAAGCIARDLEQALNTHDNVILLTHVPPLREACWHEGAISDDNALPHFACKAVGDVILRFAKEHPTKFVKVLCGHTHSDGRVELEGNIEIRTGNAEYGQPRVQTTLELP